MRFPLSWLREYCNPAISDTELSHMLTMGGFEVEAMQSPAPAFSGVVVAEIKETAQHPNADRLRVCQVDAGQGELLGIVCGAPNARPGIKIPCALVGALLPPGADGKPFAIKLSQLRGVQSQGMLCSAVELGIDGGDTGGILELPSDAPTGQDIRQYLQLDDPILTLKLTPNLGHALSVYGIARELAALSNSPLNKLKHPTTAINATPTTASDTTIPIRIQAPDLCGRFTGRIVRGINPQARTPEWMVRRLARCGQRSVNPLVDISNYVMFERGQPTHIFDLDKIQGGLTVRWAQAGEQLQLLNGQTAALDATIGIIADQNGPESLAGIMGGQATAVSDSTQNIYIEAAFWWPDAIAGRARRFNFSTEAGHRFERGVDPELPLPTLERITELVLQICGGQAGPITDQEAEKPTHQQAQNNSTSLSLVRQKTLELRPARAAKIIGLPSADLGSAECARILARLGCASTEPSPGTLRVDIPSYRFDLTLEEDLIEEVARLYGYQNLPTTPPLAPLQALPQAEGKRNRHALRHQMAALGYHETINFSFVAAQWETDLAHNPNPIQLLNPMSQQMAVMRSTLLGSLLQVLRHNLDRKAHTVRIFEIGRVFIRDAQTQTTDTSVAGVRQPMHLGGLAYGDPCGLPWERKEKSADFYDAKGDVEALLAVTGTAPQQIEFTPLTQHPALHPGRAATVRVDGQEIGILGALHPRHCQHWDLPQAPMLFEFDLPALLTKRLPQAQTSSKFPAVERDLAVLLEEQHSFADVRSALYAAQLPHLTQVQVFDIFRPQDANKTRKSMALRLTLSSSEATLTEAEIEHTMAEALRVLSAKLDAQLRT